MVDAAHCEDVGDYKSYLELPKRTMDSVGQTNASPTDSTIVPVTSSSFEPHPAPSNSGMDGIPIAVTDIERLNISKVALRDYS